MDIRLVLEDFLREHHYQLSIMAIHGFQQNGRGAIPLLIQSPSGVPLERHLLRFGVRKYRQAASLPRHVFEEEFYTRIQTYSPNSSGLLVFQLEPGPLSGYLEFQLAVAARVQFASQTLPVNWSALRPS